MVKTKSEKILPWSTRHYVLNVVTYVINTVIIAGLFILAVYLNGVTGGTNLEDYLQGLATPLHFLVLLIIIVAIMVLYFLYEDKNFLRSASNSEMLFLIV